MSMAKQAAGALRSLSAERPEVQTTSDVELALASAVTLVELVNRVGLLAKEETGADASFVLLAEGGERFRLQASLPPSVAEQGLVHDLEALARRATRAKALVPFRLAGRALHSTGLDSIKASGYREVLALLIESREQVLGVIVLLARRAAAFDAASRRSLRALAPEMSAAVENMLLFETAQRHLTEMSDLTWASSRVTATLDVATVAHTVSQAVANALSAPHVAIFLADEDGEFSPLPKGQLGSTAEKSERLPGSDHLGATALALQSPRAVADVTREGLEHDALVKWLGARSLLCVPMVAPQGLRGILAVADFVPRLFDLHVITLVSTYANQAALALQSAALYQSAVRHVHRLSKLGEVSEALTSVRDASQTAEVVLKSAVELLDAPVGLMWLVEPDTGELVLTAVHGARPGEWAMERLRPGEGLAGLAAQSGRSLVSMDVTRDGRFVYRRQAREKGLGAAIAAPLISRGRTVGVLKLYRKQPGGFSDEDKRMLMSLTNAAALAVENANLSHEVERRAQFVAGMLSEMNHRMRNSLQSVSGLLRMELKRPQARSAEAVVRRAISHVQAVACVHEAIRNHDLAFVDMKEAAVRVTQVIRSAKPECAADIQVTGARVMLPSQKAISVALVLNELVDNALRHGLVGVPKGRIVVSLAEVGGEVLLQVRDNGAGIPTDVDLNRTAGLGLEIVRGLIEQELGGKVEVDSKKGLVVRARFPKLD